MISDKLGAQLHHRAVLGEELTADERMQLEAWYAKQDLAELEAFSRSGGNFDAAALRADIDAALRRLEMLTGQVRRVSDENERLHAEISVLQQRVAMQLEIA